jgi:hypothetical protein
MSHIDYIFASEFDIYQGFFKKYKYLYKNMNYQ